MRKVSAQMIVSIFIGGLFTLSLAVPAYIYLQIHKAEAYVDQVQGALSDETRQERIDALTKQALLNTKEERAQLDELALHGDDVAGFIGSIEKEGRIAGVKFEIGNVTVTPKNDLFDTLTLSLQSAGTFSDVTLFLNLVETLPFASSVESVVIEKGSEKNALWTLNLTLSAPIHKQQ